jgi:hypothetical protein
MALSFHHPTEVALHPQLEPEVKRAILASWAFDASAVKDQPALRRTLTGEGIVPIDNVMRRLERSTADRRL